jgi:hypothetical protein
LFAIAEIARLAARFDMFDGSMLNRRSSAICRSVGALRSCVNSFNVGVDRVARLRGGEYRNKGPPQT